MARLTSYPVDRSMCVIIGYVGVGTSAVMHGAVKGHVQYLVQLPYLHLGSVAVDVMALLLRTYRRWC